MKAVSNTHFIPKSVQSRAQLDVRAGDTVRVYVKIQEKGKTRSQIFEGLVLAHRHGHEAGASIVVRKVAHGVGVERIFPIYSPMIEKIEIVRRSTVRRSKLYFIREKAARDIRKKMRNLTAYVASSEDLIPKEETVLAEETTSETKE